MDDKHYLSFHPLLFSTNEWGDEEKFQLTDKNINSVAIMRKVAKIASDYVFTYKPFMFAIHGFVDKKEKRFKLYKRLALQAGFEKFYHCTIERNEIFFYRKKE